MIIVCLGCRKKYRVNPDNLGHSRKVRCKACGNVWRVSNSDLGSTEKALKTHKQCLTKRSKKCCCLSRIGGLIIWIMVFSACVLGGYFLLKNGRFSCPNSSSCVSSEKTFCGEFKSARFSSSDGSIKVNGLVAKKKTVDGVKYITIQGRILNKSGLEQLLPKIEVNILRKSKRSNIYQDVEPSVPKSVESKSSNNLRNALLLEKVGSVYESNIELSGAIVTLLGNNSAPEIPPAAVASTSESEDASLNITTKVDGSGTETDLETNLSPLQTEEKTSQPAKVEIKGGGRMIKRIVYRFARKSLLPNEKMLFETEPIAIRDGCEDLLYDVSFIEPASANNEK